MKQIFYFLLAILSFSLIGCSGKPSDSEIENLYKKYVTNTDGGKIIYNKLLDIKNFTKLDGLEKDKNTYIVDVKFDRIFKIGSKNIKDTFTKEDLVKMFGKDDIFTNVPNIWLIFSKDRNTVAPSIYSLYSYFEPGDSIENCSKHKIEMTKKDNGWNINKVTCDKPTESQLENMTKSYERSRAMKDNISGIQETEIKNFVKIKENDVNENSYIAMVKFDRIYKIGIDQVKEILKDKISPDQIDQMYQKKNFKQGDKQASPNVKYEMSNTPDGWVISQIALSQS